MESSKITQITGAQRGDVSFSYVRELTKNPDGTISETDDQKIQNATTRAEAFAEAAIVIRKKVERENKKLKILALVASFITLVSIMTAISVVVFFVFVK